MVDCKRWENYQANLNWKSWYSYLITDKLKFKTNIITKLKILIISMIKMFIFTSGLDGNNNNGYDNKGYLNIRHWVIYFSKYFTYFINFNHYKNSMTQVTPHFLYIRKLTLKGSDHIIRDKDLIQFCSVCIQTLKLLF